MNDDLCRLRGVPACIDDAVFVQRYNSSFRVGVVPADRDGMDGIDRNDLSIMRLSLRVAYT